MNSGEELQSYSDHTQTDTPKVHQINIMENPETKKANDGLGDYENVKRGGAVDEKKEGTSKNTDKGAETVAEKDKDEGKKDTVVIGKKDTVVIVNPTPLDSSKGDCCTRFKRFCCQNKLVVALICILIFLVLLLLGLYIDSRPKAAKVSPTPPTPSPGVTSTKTTPGPGTTPTPGTTEPSAPGAVITGIGTTTENYTTALNDPTSSAYKTFENCFIAAVMCFYAENDKQYLAYYQDTVVSEFEQAGSQAIVHFQIHFSQLDSDGEVPDAHSALSDQLSAGPPYQLGTFTFLAPPSLTVG